MLQRSVLDDGSPCMSETMTNKLLMSRTHREARPRVVMHTHAAAMNVLLIGGSRYFDSLINEACRHVTALRMKSKG